MKNGIPSDVFEAREARIGDFSANAFTEAVWTELRAGAESVQKLVRDASDAAALPGKIKEFSDKNQLSVVKHGDNFDYVLKANGKDNVLFQTAATLDGLKDAQKQIDKLVDSKQVDLEKRFRVTFSDENEFVFKQKIENKNCTISRGGDVHARRPTMHELTAIEDGFAHAAPTHLSADGKEGLKIYFLKDNYYKGDPAIAYYIEEDKDKRPALYFDPGETNGVPATEKDAKLAKYHYPGRLIDSISTIIIHECAHNEQTNQKLELPKNYDKLSKEFGWVSYVDPTSKKTQYLLEGKDGTLYKFHHDDCSQPKQWVVSDNLGHPLDAGGQPTTDAAKYVTIAKKDLRLKAKITPPTNYFNNIYEEHAESATAFRVDAARRATLLKDSPAIYKAVKRWDDEAIATAYGLDTNKQPNKMRSAAGLIIDNTAGNRKTLADWEKANK